MKFRRCLFLIFVGITCLSYTHSAQETDAEAGNIQRKNVLRYNVTPSLLGFKSYIFGYERTVKPHQSFSINLGYLALSKDKSITNEEYDLIGTKKSNGFSLVADYRFYLKKENKFQAPRGVYLGPYYAFYSLNSDRTIKSNDADLGFPEIEIDAKLNIHNIGVQMGYQFLIKDRITIDLVFIGPSVSNYHLKMNATGNLDLSESEIDDAISALKDILLERYPWSKNLLDEQGIDTRGNRSSWSFGFRYLLQVGYNF